LKFRDRKRYSDRLREAQTQDRGAGRIIVAHAPWVGSPRRDRRLQFRKFIGGSMGAALGED